MGLFEKLFRRPKEPKIDGYFKMLDGYTPVFTTYDGGVYEMEFTRSCIHAFATHVSKLQPHVEGADLRGLKRILDTKPNLFQTSAQFLYKTATIYEAQNTVFILPVLDQYDQTVGFYSADPRKIEILDVKGTPWLRYTFGENQRMAIELSRCGVVSKYLYKHDLRGETNDALAPTMQLIAMQSQGIAEGIKNSASFRFMANVTNFTQPEDLAEERKAFSEKNLGLDSGGIILFPNTYTNVQQVKSSPAIVNPEQMKIIQERVFSYFGCNEAILQNTTVGDQWAAYYEGKIEPFAIQLSQAMTCMTYTEVERARSNAIVWSANRLQYMTNADKLQVSSQMFDRGIMSRNDIMDIWNMPHVEGGDKRYIRKEYTEVDQLTPPTPAEVPEKGTTHE